MRRALVLLALLAAGCGGGDEPRSPAQAPRAEAVVRAWADDLRRGDVEAASARFAVPALVSNGTPETRLATRDAVRSFNESLPCGARVTRTQRHHGLVIATFTLTERPGGDCGSGVGGTARTAFEVRDGRIVRWLRVPTGGDVPTPDLPTV
jgi:limonene-1,2-epoxide hydrolase